jgi:hypothetical protein
MIGLALPGFAVRVCPVCKRDVRSHREPVPDVRGEVVFYHQHSDGVGSLCEMSGRVAALRAVAFTVRKAA